MAEDKPSIATQFVANTMVNTALVQLAMALARDIALRPGGRAIVREYLRRFQEADLADGTGLTPTVDYDPFMAERVARESITDDEALIREAAFE